MSCRHNLANGTCIRCYPSNPFERTDADRIDPGTESDYEPKLEGPGAVTREAAASRSPCDRDLIAEIIHDLDRRVMQSERDGNPQGRDPERQQSAALRRLLARADAKLGWRSDGAIEWRHSEDCERVSMLRPCSCQPSKAGGE